ncbi:MAG: RT0821/Lpp0805 family surface protein [Rhodospirillales bacterium]
MIPIRRSTTAVLTAAFLLSACADTEGDRQAAEVVGGVVGAIVGNVLGSKVGDGTGRQIARGVGTVAGIFIGRAIARNLTERDEELAQEATEDSMENDEEGETTVWSNPDSGNEGTVTPTSEPYETVQDTQCRDFESTVTVEGETEVAHGRACRQEDGSWKIVQ